MKNREVAVIILKALTPFRIGVSEESIIDDSPILTDINELPYILGSSIKGVCRKLLKSKGLLNDSDINKLLGDENRGSFVKFSHAVVLDEKNMPVIGIRYEKSEYLKSIKAIRREHTKISHIGVSENKFDESLAPKGIRLICELECYENSTNEFETICKSFTNSHFRLGGGSRKGYGKFEVEKIYKKSFNLENDYLIYANRDIYDYKNFSELKIDKNEQVTEIIKLRFDSFWMFSQGYGDKISDLATAKEIVFEDNKIVEKRVIPATSIKGAMSHRLAYHYNRLNKSENTSNNLAVDTIFGSEKDKQNNSKAGEILFEDIYLDLNEAIHIMHVAIDRFTQKAIDGALYDEHVEFDEPCIELKLTYNKEIFKDETIKKAWDCMIFDLKNGFLPLGSCVNRGYGNVKGIE